MRRYIFLVFTICFISCQEKNEKTIESLKVWYYNGIFDRVMAIDCDEIIYFSEKVDTLNVILEDGSCFPKEAAILETIITDKEVLQEITKELQLAKRSKNYGIDARMKCYIKLTNGSVDSLCLAQSTTYGYYNGKPMRFTNKFAYLIRKNCGFYSWMGIDVMPYFDELNDTTFVRETITNRWGGKY